MTIQKKIEAYDKALERARKELQICGSANCDTARQIFRLFPELKESEDEKIRKDLIQWIDEFPDIIWRGHHKKDILAWLEKQDEKPQGKSARGAINEEKIDPKFNVGDWVVDNCGYVWKIEGILNQFYLLECVEGGEPRPTIDWVDKTFHLWTIQDAKDGDVLFDGSNILLVKEINHWRTITSHLAYSQVYGIREHLVSGSNVFIPATKKQHDLLFQKMREAGYEWNAEKKELKNSRFGVNV